MFYPSSQSLGFWAPSRYPKRRLFVRSRKVSKPRDWYFELSYRFEIRHAHRQHCCRSACQISERSDNSKYKSRGFETLRDLTERRLFGYWDGAQVDIFQLGVIAERLKWNYHSPVLRKPSIYIYIYHAIWYFSQHSISADRAIKSMAAKDVCDIQSTTFLLMPWQRKEPRQQMTRYCPGLYL